MIHRCGGLSPTLVNMKKILSLVFAVSWILSLHIVSIIHNNRAKLRKKQFTVM